MGDSRQSVAALQMQLDDYRERSRKDLLEAQRNSKDRLAELQRAQTNLKTQQEEVRAGNGKDLTYTAKPTTICNIRFGRCYVNLYVKHY